MGRSKHICNTDYDVLELLATKSKLKHGKYYTHAKLVAAMREVYDEVAEQNPDYTEWMGMYGAPRYARMLAGCLGGKYAEAERRVSDALFDPDVTVAALQRRIESIRKRQREGLDACRPAKRAKAATAT
jgi:hypothetical protein